MLTIDQSRPVPSLLGDPLWLPKESLFDLPADVLILAGGEDAMSPAQAALLPVPIVAVGANCGLSETAEQLLTDRGVLVVPDFIGGIGGSASMEALFGPSTRPEPREVLDTIASMMRELVGDILCGARDRGESARRVALDIAAATVPSADRPYGTSPYRVSGSAPRGRRSAFVTAPHTEEEVR
jgi:glutamate dehydrogenase (NAD(P)+)